MEKRKRLVIITGVSCSWKTTLQEEMIGRWWKRPINFTTRKPRSEWTLEDVDKNFDLSSTESEEYVFLKQSTFFEKLKNGDFLETTNYWWNWYWVSKFLPEGRTCVVLDPVGKAQVLQKIATEQLDIQVDTFFMETSRELQNERMKKRGDSEEEREKRKLDFNWMWVSHNDMIIDWAWSPKLLADIIENYKQ